MQQLVGCGWWVLVAGPGGCEWSVRRHRIELPRPPAFHGARHQTNLNEGYEPDMDKRGLIMVMALMVLIVLIVMMVMVLAKAMAASDGACH